MKSRVPKAFEWSVRVVERKNRRGRGMGGIVVGVKKELKETGTKMVELGEGVMYVRVRIGGESWKVVEVYVRDEDREKAMLVVRQVMETKKRETRVVMGGGF